MPLLHKIGLPLAFALCAFLSAPGSASAESIGIPSEDGRRLEVLFLGSENLFDHDPVARFRVIRKALGPEGINFTYTDTTASLTRQNLARYDALLIFANHYTIRDEEKAALLEFARGGGGCVLLHCAAGCFRKSEFPEYVDLLGAKFKSHKTGVFRAAIVAPEHELMRGWDGFECWDETYVHQQHAADRVILQRREEEPWSWVKTYGKGRVFYSASGHDHRCWDLPQFHELLRRAVRWTVGDEKTARLDALNLPKLEFRQAAVPKDPDNPVGPNNQLQLPLSPEQSLKLAQIPVGFELRVFASEPDIVNPIAINWDHRGRLWVVEAFDYPNKVASDMPRDRIKIFEDTDRDGVADKITIFAEGLNICTSVLPMDDGAIATDGANMVYLRDTDGDDSADEKTIIFSGLGQRDTHACTSNLRRGFDRWIYATVGYSGLDVTVTGRRHQSEMGVFRFKADGSDFEVLQNTTNNTWGISFTEQGDLVGSTANGNPSWYLSIPNRYFETAGLKPEKAPRADDNPTLYPITSDYFQNNPKEKVSSGAGHAIYTARRFPDDWWNRRALICEPPMHLITAPTFSNHGATFKAAGFEQNLYASADAWSAPVAAEVGPDGAVWIADWYNPICNHNPYRKHHKRGKGNGFITADRDREHGRIYRIFPSGSTEPAYPELDSVAAASDNLFWRLAASRARALDSTDSPQLIASSDRGIAAMAFSMLPREPDHIGAVVGVLSDRDAHPIVRKLAALFLADLPSDPQLGATMAKLLLTDESVTGQVRAAVGIAAIQHPEGFLRHVIEIDADPNALQPFIAKVVERKLSPGVLALARGSSARVGKLFTEAKPDTEPPRQFSASARRGKGLYLACIACHQPDGLGLENAFPPLDQSAWVLGADDRLIRLVLKGLQGPITINGIKFDGVMPGHENLLDDEEIADILSYVRNAWSNRADDVAATRVKQVRESIHERENSYTIKDLDADQ